MESKPSCRHTNVELSALGLEAQVWKARMMYMHKFVKTTNVSLHYKPVLEAGPELGNMLGA